MEATQRLGDTLGAARRERWGACFVQAGEHVLANCIDMDIFDGAIPNHGIWNHAYFYRVGQLYDRPDFMEMAGHALDRVMQHQTADGCFYEGGSAAGFPGTAVTSYNVVSLMALNMYHGHSGDPAAETALERGWHWWYDFAFPDLTTAPTLDCRTDYTPTNSNTVPAYFCNKPELTEVMDATWQRSARNHRSDMLSGPFNCQGAGFMSLQWDKIRDPAPAPQPRSWPEYTRMQREEVCIRRRHGWHAVLCGMSNRHCTSHRLAKWRLDRQCLVNLYHEDLGLIIGATHSIAQEEISTFSFYSLGSVHYLHDTAYLKSTPPLDSLLLHYHGQAGAISVDTTQAASCTITLSIQGELGRWPTPGNGHDMTAMLVKARLALRLKAGDRIEIDGQPRILSEDGIDREIPAGTTVRFPGWSICSDDAPWTFRWPVHTTSPYGVLQRYDCVAMAESRLYHRSTDSGARPTVTYRIVPTDTSASS